MTAPSRSGGRFPTTGTDRPWALSAILAFTLSLGIGPLALPLLALASGYDPVAIGLLTATSAISQFLFRLSLPALLGKVPDRALIAVACLMLSASYALLIGSTALPVFIAAELLLGGGRALFWTASQTHAVRSPGDPVRMLAQVGVVGNLGTMIGPTVTGIVAIRSLEAALGIGALLGVVGSLICIRLDHLDPYVRRSRHGEARLWRRRGVDVACWSGFAGGGWRSLVNSYVPVVLDGAGIPASLIGIMLSAADGAATVAIAFLSRLPVARLRTALDISVLVMASGLFILPFVATVPVAAAAALIVSGAGAGPLTILGAAVARSLVDPRDEGEAMALVGTFRAGALLVTPAGVAISLAVLTVGSALALAGLAIAVPATVLSLRNRA